MRFFISCFICLVMELSVSAQVASIVGGVAVFEAENFSTHTPRSGHSWVITNDIPGYLGAGFVHVTPSTGANFNVTWTNTSPELQYVISFANSGTHYVWVRGFASNLTDDSIHVGLNGSPTGGSNMTLNSTGNWAWSNITAAGIATVNSPSSNNHTFSLWMREDGARVDRIAIARRADFKPLIGQAFHEPQLADANLGGEKMRNPVSAIFSNTTVNVYSGNQDTGPGGNPGNQLQTGSIVYYKSSTSGVWRTTNMLFFTAGPSGVGGSTNKYYRGILPANVFKPGEIIQYYLRIAYDTHLTTYLYGNDNLSLKSEFESDAQADPYSYTIKWPLQPSGPFTEITNITAQGVVLARIYTESGHLSVLGPDVNGNQLAQVINFSPPEAFIGGETHLIGKVLSTTPSGNGIELMQQLSSTSVVSRLIFTDEGVVQYEVLNWGSLPVERTALTAESDANEHVYGFGEKFNSFDQSGKNVRILTWDPFGDKGDQSYKVAPWFVSTRGYGFHLESTAESYFDMRAANADRWIVSNLFPSLKFRVVYGPGLTNVLERYTAYSGRPPLPPAWSFAPWISSDIWRSGGDIRFLLTKLRERGIPGSTLVFDSPWEVAYNDFTWNMTQFSMGWTNNVPGEAPQNWPGFSSVNEMMTFIRTNGYKVICWMTPFVNTNSNIEHTNYYGSGGVPGQNIGKSSNYNFAATNNYFVRASAGGPPLISTWWKGRGSPVDFTNPDARFWMMLQLSNLVAQSGGVIGGFKTDDGETGTIDDTFIPTTAVYYDGRTGIEMRNGFSLEYHRTIWNVLGTNGILFARSGFAGSHAYPAYWAGDNQPNFGDANGMPGVIIAGQSAAMSAYSIWSHDIGGYQDGNHSSTPSNLFMRWTQFGAFSPLMQMHRQTGTNRQFPWSYGPQAESNYQFYARLHTSLFPYRYTYAKQSADRGLPIIRPLVLMNQTDANTYGINHTYLYGNEFLAAIMITNVQVQRNVYLPAGTWYDFWNDQSYAGSQNILWTNANQSLFPLFVRKGAIIPMISTNTRTLLDSTYMGHTNIASVTDEIIFRIYPDASSSFTMYDGTYAECSTNQTVTSVELTSITRPVQLVVLANEPFSVERDGIVIPHRSSLTQLTSFGYGWWYNTNDHRVYIREGTFNGTHEYRFGPDSVGDGVSDSWRLTHFGSANTTNATSCVSCDPDNDGMTNYEEFNSGTNPNQQNSVFKVAEESLIAVSNVPNAVISWAGVSGFTYTISWKNAMDDTVIWQIIPTAFTGTGSMIYWYDDGTFTGTSPDQSPTGQRYYQIRTP